MSDTKQIIKIVLLVCIIFVASFQVSLQIGFADENDVIKESDIVYGKGGDVDLKLDLARPAKAKGRLPALIFIHGGGWHSMSKGEYYSDIYVAAKRGYVAVTIDYRLTSVKDNGKVKYPFPAQVHDVKCAVRWLRANARKYKIDPKRIGVVGWSSGGHLSLMLGLTDPFHGLEGECGNMKYSSHVQAVVSLAGITDVRSQYEDVFSSHRYITDFIGGTPEEMPERYTEASPLTYLSKDDPPTLTIQGDKDFVVSPSQAELLDKRMNEVGATHTLIMKKDVGHTGLVNFFVDNEVWDFFDEHLKGK
jgi:acetyl esterase/lipase